MTALGLQKDPFSPEPDPQFYYSFDTFEQRLRVLKGLVQGQELLVLIIGEPGSGKTTLLNRYLATIETEWKPTRIHTGSKTGTAQSSKAQEQGEYPAFILQDSANPIVIIDNAHLLSHSELALLITKAQVPDSNNQVKRLILLGESKLYTTVNDLAASISAQPAVNKIYLPGLTETQTADYLKHRLAISGYSGKNPFNSSAIKSIHQNSGGYPGPINEIAHRWLNEKYSGKKEGQSMLKKLSATPRRMVAWIAAGVIIILLAALGLFSDHKPSTLNSPDKKVTKTVLRKKMPQNPKTAKRIVTKKIVAVKTPVKPPAAVNRQQIPDAKAPAETPKPIKNEQPSDEKTMSLKQTTAAHSKIARPPQEDLQQQPKPEPNKTMPVVAIKKEKTTLPEPSTAVQTKTDSQPNAGLQQEKSPMLSKTAPVVAENRKETVPLRQKTADSMIEDSKSISGLQQEAKTTQTTPVPVQINTAPKEVRRENWLLSQNAESYTIQIVGVSKEESMLDFINRHQFLKQTEFAYYETTFRGKPWYQLLYGLYPSRRDARLAANQLPENIRRAGPWIRRISAVQNAIRN